MGKATRSLAMAGMALIAGATVGAGPAMASAPIAQAPSVLGATVSTQVAVKQVQVQSRDRVVGYYRTLRSCDHAGRLGERRGRWDSYDCDRVRHGFRRGWWALEVRWGHGNGGHGNGGHGNGGHNGGGNGNGGHNGGGNGNGGHGR